MSSIAQAQVDKAKQAKVKSGALFYVFLFL
jgi:hypothetical protein